MEYTKNKNDWSEMVKYKLILAKITLSKYQEESSNVSFKFCVIYW